MKALDLTVESQKGTHPLHIEVQQLVIGGWAGRDKAAMEHHMEELEKLGVKRPESTPVYYRVAATRLTTQSQVEDQGANSSGEVETVLFAAGGKMYVGVGSDHTDREVETYGISVSKQLCDKPIASRVWPFEEVEQHWDALILRSYAVINGSRVLYQEGPVSSLLAPADLIKGLAGGGALPDGMAMFGGTMPAIGGIRVATRFEAELQDPVLGRSIHFGYDVIPLPIKG